MKIVCDSCGAKYSIADEKVQGKVFKIRCKKCGDSIVVKGDAKPEPEPVAPAMFAPEEEEGDAETRVFDYSGYQGSDDGDAAIWHIVVDGNQQGPYTAAQIREFLSAGSLDAEGFIWREGFDDWLPIKDVPEIGQAPDSAQTPDPNAGLFGDAQAPAERAAPATGGGGLFDSPQDDAGLFGAGSPESSGQPSGSPFDGGGGLFGADSGPSQSEQVFSSAPSGASSDGGGLFSASDNQAPPTGGLFSDDSGGGGADVDLFGAEPAGGGAADSLFDDKAPAMSPRVSQEQAMTGQRNENSVLFSLSNLQALASGPGAGSQPQSGGSFGSSSMGSAPAVTNTGGSEGSGLIDIRSLANSLSAAENETQTNTSVDDLISLGGGGFGPGLGAPVLAAQNIGMSTGAKIGIGALVLIFAALVVIGAVFIATPNENPQEAQIAALREQIEKLKTQESSSSSGAAATSPQLQELEKQLQKAEDQKQLDVPAESDKPKQSASASNTKSSSSTARKRNTSATRQTASKSPSSSSSGSSASGSQPAATTSRSSGSSSKKGSSELDDLLGGGSKAPKKKPTATNTKPAASSSSSTAKTGLGRADVQKGMNSVAGKIKNCGQGKTGTVTLKVVIAGTGRVVSASPSGQYSGTSVGACAARAVRGARFPKFSGSNLTVRYPFKL